MTDKRFMLAFAERIGDLFSDQTKPFYDTTLATLWHSRAKKGNWNSRVESAIQSHNIEATARQAALQRALLGEVVSESNYHALCNQLIEAATVLSQDNQNGQWLKGHLNDTLIDLW